MINVGGQKVTLGVSMAILELDYIEARRGPRREPIALLDRSWSQVRHEQAESGASSRSGQPGVRPSSPLQAAEKGSCRARD